jgi:iron complex transport system ATP-binding protein
MRLALQSRGLRLSLGQREVLRGIDLEIPAGRWTCVVGPNGAGKSTLLKAMAGLLPFQGEVCWHGRPLSEIGRRERALGLSWLGQAETASQDLVVQEVVMLGRLPHQDWLSAPTPQDHAMVEAALKATQAWEWRERPLGELSAGQRQRVLLARLMASNTAVMLMDEPLTNLDPPHQVDWLEQVHCLLAQGTTVVSVLHEIGMALHADDLVVMDQGTVVHHGACNERRTREAVEAVFGHRIRILSVDGQWAVLPRSAAHSK